MPTKLDSSRRWREIRRVDLAAEKFGEPIRLNLGCGAYHFDGFVHVDLNCEKADVRGDIRELEFVDVETVKMIHVLEHIPHGETQDLLRNVFSWMNPGGEIVIEVPDTEALLNRKFDRFMEMALFGVQTHAGEFHYSAFTMEKLIRQITGAGWYVANVGRFNSTHPARIGFPSIEVKGVVPK